MNEKIGDILEESFEKCGADIGSTDFKEVVANLSEQVVTKEVAKLYGEFCVRCDREGIPLLDIFDFVKLYID